MEKKNTHIVYGAITGVVIVITMLVLYVTGLTFKPGMANIQYIPFLAGIILNAMAFSKANEGYVTFGSVFGSCFKATMVIALVMVLWAVISIIAFPEMKQKYLEMAQEQLLKSKVSDTDIDRGMAFAKKGYNTLTVASAVFGTLIAGLIFSLIAAAVAKKNGERPFNV